MEKTEVFMEVQQKTALPPLGKALRAAPKVAVPLPKRLHLAEAAQQAAIWATVFLWSRGEVLQIFHPLGMSMLSVFFGQRQYWMAFSAVALGSIGNGAGIKSFAVCLAAALIQLSLARYATSSIKKSSLGAFAMALGGLFYAVGQGGLRFYFAVAGVESLLVWGIGFLLQKGMGVLFGKVQSSVWSREETLSALLVLGGALSGASHIGIPILQDKLFPFLMTIFLLLAAWREGVGGGAAAGVMLGFLLYICGAADLPLFVMLGLGGLLAGCLKEIGRWAAVVAFWLTAALLLFYLEQEFMQPDWLPWIAAGGILFLLLPRKVLCGAGGLWQVEQTKDRYTQMRQMTEQKLQDFGGAFHALAKAFAVEQETPQTEISRLVDAVAARVCKGCGMAQYCWTEEVYRTYSMTFSLFSMCDGCGKIDVETLPQWFRDTCPRSAAYASGVCEIYERHHHDLVWTGRLQECRTLVGQQLDAVGDILQKLTNTLDDGCEVLEQAQTALLEACHKVGIHPKEIQVTQQKNGRGTKARICIKSCHGKGVCREKILPIVKKTLGRNMIQQEAEICHLEGNDCILTFVQAPAYALATATAFASGQTGKPCGDAAAFLESEQGMALLAVSDGMGMGADAAAESKAAIELLEAFAEAGFSRELAIQLINSALLLRRAEENYATLDICSIDLYDGQAEFIKLGAAPSFICRQSRVISIYTNSLPAGILQEVQVVKNEMRLKDGDMLLMVTDGVTDALGGVQQTAAWLEEKFLPRGFANPQDAADFVLQQAQQACQKERDDMTVQAARLWRKWK